MNKYSIRFNKSRGQNGRGTVDHVWRVFENEGKEYLFKHLDITCPIKSEKDKSGGDWNIVCHGYLTADRETSTAIITPNEPMKPNQSIVLSENS